MYNILGDSTGPIILSDIEKIVGKFANLAYSSDNSLMFSDDSSLSMKKKPRKPTLDGTKKIKLEANQTSQPRYKLSSSKKFGNQKTEIGNNRSKASKDYRKKFVIRITWCCSTRVKKRPFTTIWKSLRREKAINNRVREAIYITIGGFLSSSLSYYKIVNQDIW